jgi:hypothetical protein
MLNPSRLSCCLLGLLGLALVDIAPADECDELPLPAVMLKRIEAPVTLNLTYSYGSLTNIGRELASPGNTVLGLTRGNAIVRFETQIPSYLGRNSRFECASPQITVFYGFKPMTLYVAREFPPGSCAHKEIYEHEQRHVKTYEDHLAAIEKDIVATLNQRFATGAPWRGPVGSTTSRIQEELDARWLPYITREIERVKVAQALIDTPEEYARITESCGGEIKNQLGKRP